MWHIGGYILDRSVKNNKKTRTNTLSSKKLEKVIKSIGNSPSFVIHLSSKKKDHSANQRDGNMSRDYSFLSSYFTIHGVTFKIMYI